MQNNQVPVAVLLEKLLVAQLVRKFPVFMELTGSLLYSRKSATGTYPHTVFL